MPWPHESHRDARGSTPGLGHEAHLLCQQAEGSMGWGSLDVCDSTLFSDMFDFFHLSTPSLPHFLFYFIFSNRNGKEIVYFV